MKHLLKDQDLWREGAFVKEAETARRSTLHTRRSGPAGRRRRRIATDAKLQFE